MAAKGAASIFGSKCRNCDDVIALIWGLNSTDRRVLSMLCAKEDGELGVAYMAKKLNLTPGRIAQRLDMLVAEGLASRKKKGLAKGYMYVYFSPNKKELAKLARARLEGKIREMEQALEK